MIWVVCTSVVVDALGVALALVDETGVTVIKFLGVANLVAIAVYLVKIYVYY